MEYDKYCILWEVRINKFFNKVDHDLNLEEYQKNKEIRKNEFKNKARRTLCLNCFRPKKACFCHEVKSFETNTRFVILMHPKEARKEPLGTGRLAQLSLLNSEIIVGENFKDCIKVNSYLNDGKYKCMLLYPGESSHNISKSKLEFRGELVVFIIDGTWPCARSMLRDSPNLHDLDKISFDNTKLSSFIIKQQPADYCLSTIESLHILIDGLNLWGHESLEREHYG
ncbi:DTW domain-containing protein, partial [bacterium]|nr:DTW domain-containing protein [bacterium]